MCIYIIIRIYLCIIICIYSTDSYVLIYNMHIVCTSHYATAYSGSQAATTPARGNVRSSCRKMSASPEVRVLRPLWVTAKSSKDRVRVTLHIWLVVCIFLFMF